MEFGLVRLIDQILGRILLLVLAPVCIGIEALLPPRSARTQPVFTFIKVHGGGSLLIAMQSLLGIRKKYPNAELHLVCTEETRKYAELTGVFDQYVMIEQRNIFGLLASGWRALRHCFRRDACIDLEPHSFLAALFTLLTLSVRRLGFVKPNELFRARAYTEALYFNPFAPIYAFYDQMAGLLGAQPATIAECQARLVAPACPVKDANGKTIVYISPFCSDFAQERMMPNDLWPRLLQKHYGTAALKIQIGGGVGDLILSQKLIGILQRDLPDAEVINLCGRRTLAQSVEDIRVADAFWGIDSGPLHIARLLGRPSYSFWGPTNPQHRLRAIPGLIERTAYLGFACSPCIDSVERAPCKGNNQCMKLLLDPPLTTPPIEVHAAREY